ncbi:MAG: CHAD domain-containing protein [Prochlorotrichaceae cyanobacterium]|jgi:CHAD domain-containing protein
MAPPETSQQETVRATPSLSTVLHSIVGSTFKRADRFREAILDSQDNDRKPLDPEDIHQMRVSLRQLRSCLQVFQHHLHLEKPAEEAVVKSLAKVLGAVRDLDILQEQFQEQYLPRLPETEQDLLQKMLRQWQRKRARRLQVLYDRLDSDSYRRFKKAYRRWLKEPQFSNQADLSFHVLAPDILLSVLCQLLQHPGWFVATIAAEGSYAPLPLSQICLRDLRHQEVAVHDLRKGIKQLRYQLVLLSPFLDEGAATSLNAIVNALKTFQDILGNLQDLAVIRHLLTAFLQQKGLQPEALQTCFQILDQEYLALWQQWQPHQTQYLSPTFRFELRQHFAELSR